MSAQPQQYVLDGPEEALPPLGDKSRLFGAVLSVATGRLGRINERANRAVRECKEPHPLDLIEQDWIGYLAGEYRKLQADVEALVVADREYNASKVAMYQLEHSRFYSQAVERFESACAARTAALAKFGSLR